MFTEDHRVNESRLFCVEHLVDLQNVSLSSEIERLSEQFEELLIRNGPIPIDVIDTLRRGKQRGKGKQEDEKCAHGTKVYLYRRMVLGKAWVGVVD